MVVHGKIELKIFTDNKNHFQTESPEIVHY